MREAPDAGKQIHLSVAVPQELKRKVEESAAARGWSVSVETAHRLESTFEQEGFLHQVIALAYKGKWADFLVALHKQKNLNPSPAMVDKLVKTAEQMIRAEFGGQS